MEWLATRDTGMGAEGGITTEVDAGMDRTTVGTGVDMDAEDLGVVDLAEVALEVVKEALEVVAALVGVMPMVEVLEEVMGMAEVVDAGGGTMEDLNRMAVKMVEDLVLVVEVEVVAEEVVCRADQGEVGTLLL